jgi:hypothetical protein
MVATVRIRGMGGLMPRIDARLLPENMATVAEGVKLWEKTTKPFRGSKRVYTIPRSMPVTTVHRLLDRWLSWDKDVDVVESSNLQGTQGRFFFTGDGVPKHSNYGAALSAPPFPTKSWDLGVVPPDTVPTVSVSGLGVLPLERRSYVFTKINRWYEESVPSFPSPLTNVLPGQQVEVSNFGEMDETIIAIRIYRTDPIAPVLNSEFLLVDEIPASVTSYLDLKASEELTERLPSQSYYPPPPGLFALVAMPNGFMAAIDKDTNTIRFSEPKQPHAWPPEYAKQITEGQGVALSVYGNTLVVLTTGRPMKWTGVDPRAMSPERESDPMPCVSKRSVAAGPRGVYFASTAGLAFVGFGGAEIKTRTVLSPDNWAGYNPSTLLGKFYQGRYYGFGAQRSFVFDDIDATEAFDESARFAEMPELEGVSAAFASPSDFMFFVRFEGVDSGIYQWEGGAYPSRYRWESKAFTEFGITSFAAAKVVGDFDRRRSTVNDLLDEEYRLYAAPRVACFSAAGVNGSCIGSAGHGTPVDFTWLSTWMLRHNAPPVAAYNLFSDWRPIVFRMYNAERLLFEREVASSEPFRLKAVGRHIVSRWGWEGSVAVKDVQAASSITELAEREG